VAENLDDIVLSFPRDAYNDLAAVAQHLDDLESVAACVVEKGVTADTPTIVACLARRLELPREEARRLLYGLLNLHHLRQDLSLGPSDLVEVVTKTLERSAPKEWKEANIEQWGSNRSLLAEALSPQNPVAILEKARVLQYSHQNTLRDARILTDVRPVFDHDAGEILGGLVVHRLVIQYTENGVRKRMHFALDADDVQRLKSQCERAERKAATAEEVLKPSWTGAPKEGESHGR